MGFSRLDVSEKVLCVQEVRKWVFPDGKQIDGFLCRWEISEYGFFVDQKWMNQFSWRQAMSEWVFLQMGDECTGFLQAGSEWVAGFFQRLDGNLFNVLL